MTKIFQQMCEQINEAAGSVMVDLATRQKVGRSDSAEIVMEQIETFSTDWIKASSAKRQAGVDIYDKLWPGITEVSADRDKHLQRPGPVQSLRA